MPYIMVPALGQASDVLRDVAAAPSGAEYGMVYGQLVDTQAQLEQAQAAIRGLTGPGSAYAPHARASIPTWAWLGLAAVPLFFGFLSGGRAGGRRRR